MLTTISDRKIGVYSYGSLTLPGGFTIPVVNYYEPEMLAANDYYPLGMLSRTIGSSAKYKFGFNGKENDNEIKGEGNSIEFGARMYDPRIGRWFSVDPLREVYTSLSPYSYSANNPVNVLDDEGNILKDKNGNIIATSTGTFSSSSMAVGYSVEKSTGNITTKEVYRKYEVVKIYADDGTPIEALKLVESYVVVSQYDKKGNLLSTAKDDLAKHGYEAVSDCHGYTFAKGKLWINDDQVNTLLDHDGYSRNVSEGSADAAIFKKGGAVVHSAVRNKNGTYSNDAGTLTVEKNVSLDKSSRGLTDIKGKGNVEFVDKKAADKQVDIKSGTVDNGVRYTTEAEVKKALTPSSVPGTAPKPTTSVPKFDFKIPPQRAAVNATYVKPPIIIPLKKP
ncbi:RHS repeat-associated core domain-containing protein [Paraflavitalea speifideaquila]|uniref:RHS repeat-associated core domain-containing protein n=1 Tax=Paraflavitalea speifideaquila TaxID=3076558 RepID=UPI0028ED5997|nr:RHS repeat-associated core domain-containing protein [Paraflavitalea speifideiaquila]